MSRPQGIKAVVRSERVYRRMLRIYPTEHRREYGEAMVQCFRDLCHDAWTTAGVWGLVGFWLRTAMDLARTSLAEHLNNMRQGKYMLHKSLTFSTPRAAFLKLFGTVFTIVLCLSLIVAFSTPDQYSSTVILKIGMAKVDPTPDASARVPSAHYDPWFVQGQFELMLSDRLLGQVVSNLGLAETGQHGEAIKNLRKRIDLTPIKHTALCKVRVVSTNSKEAARIANAIAKAYREFSTQENDHKAPRSVEIIDTAVPGLKPVRPNKPLTIFLGFFGGAILAGVVGGAGALAMLTLRRRPPVVGNRGANVST